MTARYRHAPPRCGDARERWGGSAGTWEQSTSDSSNPTGQTDESQARGSDKCFADLQALAALRGLRVDRMSAGASRHTYVVRLGSWARDCADLNELRAALQRMGVQ